MNVIIITSPPGFSVTGGPTKTGSKFYLVNGKPEGEATGSTAEWLLRALKLKKQI